MWKYIEILSVPGLFNMDADFGLFAWLSLVLWLLFKWCNCVKHPAVNEPTPPVYTSYLSTTFHQYIVGISN